MNHKAHPKSLEGRPPAPFRRLQGVGGPPSRSYVYAWCPLADSCRGSASYASAAFCQWPPSLVSENPTDKDELSSPPPAPRSRPSARALPQAPGRGRPDSSLPPAPPAGGVITLQNPSTRIAEYCRAPQPGRGGPVPPSRPAFVARLALAARLSVL